MPACTSLCPAWGNFHVLRRLGVCVHALILGTAQFETMSWKGQRGTRLAVLRRARSEEGGHKRLKELP